MGLASEMKNLSDELLASFKQRIRENEELVSEVQKTLDGFHKDHQEMAATLNANAMALRKNLSNGEKERINSFNGLMSGIHHSIASIQKEVMDIQKSTFNMINDFASDRTQMADELNKFFSEGRADRMEDEKIRIKEFDVLMKNINDDIKIINGEVMAIFKNTNDMLRKFENDHKDMSADLRAELGKNLAERVEFTRSLLNGFQKRLLTISKENQKTAQKLRKDLANGEESRLSDYKGLMKDIHSAIKGIRKEVNGIQKETAGMLADLSDERIQGANEWNKMQDEIAHIRKKGVVKPEKEIIVKTGKKKEAVKEIKVEVATGDPDIIQLKTDTKQIVTPVTLEEKILDYINNHPMGVKISEMEQPLNETRMKLGFIAKALLEVGKVQKMDNLYFPIK
jgi:hypothetical protein